MKQKKRNIITFTILISIIFVIGGYFLYGNYINNKISKMTFIEMVNFTTKNNNNAAITVGVINNGIISYKVYGKNAEIIQNNGYVYEIGSITKTFIASILQKAILEGEINLNSSINSYLDLPKKVYYPTLKQLITHTSGYKDYYLNLTIILNYLNKDKNSFYGINNEKLIERIGKIDLLKNEHDFLYSNFGIAVIGAVLSKVYNKNISELINEYIKTELELENTMIFNNSGNLGNYWIWDFNDAFIPAGALTSTIDDMLKYTQFHMDGIHDYLLKTHEILVNRVIVSENNFTRMNIRIDGIGMAWMIDKVNNVIWHNGGTSNYNSYLGFDKEKNIGVVVLSNLSPDYRVSATAMGIKYLLELQNE